MFIIKKKTFLNIIIIIFFVLPLILGVFYKISNAESSNLYNILIDIEESKLYFFKNGVLQNTYACAGGKASTPSPIGTWKIVSKGLWGEGYGGRFMGLDCPWGKFGIHGTTDIYSVGWNSSHGCIRMNNNDVAELYKIVPIGTKVTIINGVYGNFGRGFRILKSGMYGADVYEIQKKLKELGFFSATPNGIFGSETEKALKKYCEVNGKRVTKVIDEELQKDMGFTLID